jgi:putative ABC transport system ATP-binding protein
MEPLIDIRKANKVYFKGQPNELQVLFDVSLKIYPGEFVSIVGQSGSGKSTLMNIMGILDKPTTGRYFLSGRDLLRLGDDDLSTIRNRKIGFVFQNFNLVSRTSALKNVEMPMFYAGIAPKLRTERAMRLLKMVGMDKRARHNPNELSGGQKQRISIARAMANNPDIILADEPTGSLDSKTGRMVMDLFHSVNRKLGKTIVLVTHSPELALETGRIITLSDGRIVDISRGEGNGGKH